MTYPDIIEVEVDTGQVITVEGCGGSGVHTQEVFYGPGVTIADLTAESLPWGTSSGPDSLLDVTDPLLPTVIESGTYAVTVTATVGNMTVGGYMVLTLELDVAGTDVYLREASAVSVTDPLTITLSAVWYLTAGMSLQVRAVNRDGVASREFNLVGYVQRLA